MQRRDIRIREVGSLASSSLIGIVGMARPFMPAVMGILCALFLAMAASGSIYFGLNGVLVLSMAIIPLLSVYAWYRHGCRTLPLVVTLMLLDCVWFVMPLAADNPSIASYGTGDRAYACLSIAIYQFAMFCSWYLVAVAGRPSKRGYYRFLSGAGATGGSTGAFVAVVVLVLCAAFEACLVTEWVEVVYRVIPASYISASNAILAVCEAIAILAIFSNLRVSSAIRSVAPVAWAAFVVVFMARMASILLSSCVGLLASLIVSLFLGTGRIPWKTIIVFVSILGFFNLSKFTMRARYWEGGLRKQPLAVSEVPAYFAEWIGLSSEMLFEGDRRVGGGGSRQRQSLAKRVDGFEMVLYVNSQVVDQQRPPLHGETYSWIPYVLVPRALWKEKPRTHIAQEILSVHFRKQTRAQTFQTYIAWGLVPESIGNFGPVLGPAMLGVFLGWLLGLCERAVAYKPLFSLGSLAVVFLWMSLITVPGSVSTVILAGIEQSLGVLICGLYPFTVKRHLSAA